jgi:hypothetical protein
MMWKVKAHVMRYFPEKSVHVLPQVAEKDNFTIRFK